MDLERQCQFNQQIGGVQLWGKMSFREEVGVK
jgi:hypothetical protein